MPMKSLEIIHFDFFPSQHYFAPPPTIYISNPARLFGMFPWYAAQLRAFESLRYTHVLHDSVDCSDLNLFARLDTIEESGDLTGQITSLRNGSEEVLLVRIFQDCIETGDEKYTYSDLGANDDGDDKDSPSGGSPTPEIPSYQFAQKWYTALDGSRRRRSFARLSVPIWQTYTDYGGLVVPLAIINSMKEENGADVDYELRGVSVSASAWGILQAWYATARAEALKELSREDDQEGGTQ